MRSLVTSSAIALMLATPALARSAAVHERAQAPATLAAWTKQVSRALDRNLTYPDAPVGQAQPEGTVAVKFLCSDSGAPTDVELLTSSGSRALDQAAARAVKKIVSLHPLPEGMSHAQKFRAVILFASSQESADRQLAKINKDALANNQWFGRSDATAMNIGLLPADR